MQVEPGIFGVAESLDGEVCCWSIGHATSDDRAVSLGEHDSVDVIIFAVWSGELLDDFHGFGHASLDRVVGGFDIFRRFVQTKFDQRSHSQGSYCTCCTTEEILAFMF